MRVSLLNRVGTVGVGAINMAGFAQTFAMTGNLPITNLPENYRSAASNMEWVALQPKIGPISPAPTEEQLAQAAELADLSSRFPSVPVEITLTPGSTEVSTTPAETPTTPDSAPTTTPPSVVVVPLPEQELVNNNGTRPTPFKPTETSEENSAQDEETASTESNDDSSAQENEDDDDSETPETQTPSLTTPPSNQVQSGTGPFVDVPSTSNQVESTTGDGGDTNTPSGNGGFVDRPATTTPPATPPTQAPTVVPNPLPGPVAAPSPGNAVQGGEEGNGPIINVPALPTNTPGVVGNNSVVVDIPASSPPPVAQSPPPLSPPPKVPVVKPLPLPGSPSPPPGEGDTQAESLTPTSDDDLSPPNGTGDKDAENTNADGGKSPEPTPTPTPTISGAVGTSPEPGKKDLPMNEADKEEDEGNSTNSNTGSTGHGHGGHGLKPVQPLTPNKRRLLVSDPLAALSSSGFSYIVVTATADDAVNATDAATETVGASALSRIRTIQAVGEGPGADSRRLKALWDVLFWTAIAVAATLVLHLGVLGILYWAKKPVPKMLHLPRMELLVFMMTLPMIAAAGAALFRSTTPGIIFLGVFFSVLLPFGFLGVVSVFLVRYLLRTAVERRRALYVLVATQEPGSEQDSRVAGNPAPLLSAGFETSSRENSLTAYMLGPDTRDTLSQVSRSTSASELEIVGVEAPEEGPSGSGSNNRRISSDSGAGPSTSAGAETSTRQENNLQQQQTSQTREEPKPTFFRKAGHVIYQRVLRPVFGFQERHTAAAAEASTDGAAWLGRGKWDAEFVKRYGCFFEDTHGPQVLRVRSRYDPTAALPLSPSDEVVGSGVLVPATPAGTEGAMQALQTFGVVFAVTKMVLFAVIINGPGGVNNMAQVLALVLVAAMHVVYLRLCTPYRLRVELAAEMVASTCDLAIFACGVALIAKREWSPSERHNMGIAMLALQAVGFLIFITVRVALGLRTLAKTVGPAVKSLLPQRRSTAASSQFVVSN